MIYFLTWAQFSTTTRFCILLAAVYEQEERKEWRSKNRQTRCLYFKKEKYIFVLKVVFTLVLVHLVGPLQYIFGYRCPRLAFSVVSAYA